MMVPVSKEYIKKLDLVAEWMVYDSEVENLVLRDDAPQEIVEMRQWLTDNDPAKDFPFKD